MVKLNLLRSAGPFVLGLLGAAFFLAGLSGEGNLNQIAGVVRVAYRDGALALLWWGAAWGLGIGLTRLATGPSLRSIRSAATGSSQRRDSDETTLDELAIALGLGSALMLVLDATAGTLGLISASNGLVGWGLLGAGLLIGVRVIREAPVTGDESSSTLSAGIIATYGLGFGAICGLLIVAASISPGWLWSSEFSGFDALSYHLELPKQWFLSGGKIAPVEGVVYSALPSYVESAFLHLMSMRGNPIDGAYACQWWSMLATVATAFVLARLGRALIGPGAGVLAAAAFLATPWTTVVGTLAYNDMYPCLALASGWLLMARATGSDQRLDARAVLGLTLLASAAFGAKPSSILFTSLALLVLSLLRAGPRVLGYAPMALLTGVLLLAPWLVRNQLAYGSPCFPFLSGLFGLGPWTQEQMTVFLGAHGPSGSLTDRLGLLFEQWLGYGFGAAPSTREPWFALWGVLPLVGVATLIGLSIRARAAVKAWPVHALAVTLVMCAGWMLATHLKSRFLLPTVVPLALGAAALLTLLSARIGSRAGAKLVVGALMVALALPFFAFMREPVRANQELRAPSYMIDSADKRTGDWVANQLKELPPEQQQELLANADSIFMMNFGLPADARIVAIGFATPFYVLRPMSWTTVWDRGEFDRVVDEAPGTPAAWGPRLRARGFTHAVIDPTMLSVWARSGWINPALASDAWFVPFSSANKLFGKSIDGRIILTLTPPPTQGGG